MHRFGGDFLGRAVNHAKQFAFGVGLDDCEAVSRGIDPWLDEQDFIPGSYTLEVSSPGVERILHTREQITRFIGSKVKIKLYRAENGKRIFSGLLTGCHSGITVDCNGETLTFEKNAVAQIRLDPF